MRRIIILLSLLSSLAGYSQSFVRHNNSIVANPNRNAYRWIQEGDLQINTPINNYNFIFTIRAKQGYLIDVDWGDGNTQKITLSGANSQALSHRYDYTGVYNIFITGDVDKIEKFDCTAAVLTGKITSRFKRWTLLKYFRIEGSTNFRGGSLDNISHVTDTLIINNCGNLVTGNINILSKNLKYLHLLGGRQLYTGSPDSLSKRLSYLHIYNGSGAGYLDKVHLDVLSDSIVNLTLWNHGDSILGVVDSLNRKNLLRTITLENAGRFKYKANLDKLYNLTDITLTGPGITGSINSLVNVKNIVIGSAANVTGSINSTFASNSSSIGSLRINYCPGVTNNDIQYLKKVNTVLQFNFNGITYGSTDSLKTTLNQLYLQGSTSNYSGVTGTLEKISSGLVLMQLAGYKLNYNGGAVPAWSNSGIGTTFTINVGLTESELRSFLINWSTTAATRNMSVYVAGTNAPIHVNATDDPQLYNAIQTLIAKGKTITYNAY